MSNRISKGAKEELIGALRERYRISSKMSKRETGMAGQVHRPGGSASSDSATAGGAGGAGLP